MVTQVVSCYHCGSKNLVKNGHAPNGKRKYGCKDCGKASRENPAAKGYDEKKKEEILSAYQERSSIRGLTRTFGVSRTTVTKWLKKALTLGALKDTLVVPSDSSKVELELDEMWSFVRCKGNKRWVQVSIADAALCA